MAVGAYTLGVAAFAAIGTFFFGESPVVYAKCSPLSRRSTLRRGRAGVLILCYVYVLISEIGFDTVSPSTLFLYSIVTATGHCYDYHRPRELGRIYGQSVRWAHRKRGSSLHCWYTPLRNLGSMLALFFKR